MGSLVGSLDTVEPCTVGQVIAGRPAHHLNLIWQIGVEDLAVVDLSSVIVDATAVEGRSVPLRTEDPLALEKVRSQIDGDYLMEGGHSFVGAPATMVI